MKKSYIKIFILEIALLAFILYVNFVMNSLTNYILIALLIVSICLLKILLGHEKGKFRYTKDVILIVIIYTILVLLLLYLLGLFASFTKTINYFTKNNFFKYILPILINIIVVEMFRNSLVQKSQKFKILICLTIVLFVIVDVILKIDVSTFSSGYNSFIFISYYLIPSIAKNILCTYMCLKVGYNPAIIYRIIIEMYAYILPYYPNFGEYINSIIRIIIPVILIIILYKSLNFNTKEVLAFEPNSIYQKIGYTFTIIFIIMVIYLTSGIFRYYAVAIGSGSMSPTIHKGDIVIIQKLSKSEKFEIQIGDILAYKYGDILVIHRIIDIYNDKRNFYVYTKGDANSNADNYPIDESSIVGIVKYNIPFIGYPVILLNENSS